MPDAICYINTSARNPAEALVAGYTSPLPVDPPIFPRGSKPTIALHCLKENPDPSASTQPFVYVNPTDWDGVRMALGPIDAPPTNGTFTITDSSNAQTTAPIPFGASIAAVQAAIRAGLITNYGNATVTAGDSTSSWIIDRGVTGAIADLTVNPNLLVPAGSTALVENVRNGDADFHEVFEITLLRPLAALLADDDLDPLPVDAVNVAVATAGSGTVNKSFRLTWNADAYNGGVTVSFTGDTATATVGPIVYNATADDVVIAFQRHTDVEVGGVVVIKNGPGDYSITCVGAGIKLSNTPALAASANTLQVPVGFTGVFNLDTPGMSDLLGTNSTTTTVFEIKKIEGGVPSLLVQITDAPVIKDLIRHSFSGSTSGSSGTGTPLTSATGLQFLPLVSGYTGGGSTKLDGQVTAGLEVPQTFIFKHATLGGRIFQLRTRGAGPEAAVAGQLVVPLDWNGTTNNKIWESLL